MSDKALLERQLQESRACADSLAAHLRERDLADAKAKAEQAAIPPPVDHLAIAQAQMESELADPAYLELLRTVAWQSTAIWVTRAKPDGSWPEGTDAATWVRRENGLTDDGTKLLNPPQVETPPPSPVKTVFDDMLAAALGRKR